MNFRKIPTLLMAALCLAGCVYDPAPYPPDYYLPGPGYAPRPRYDVPRHGYDDEYAPYRYRPHHRGSPYWNEPGAPYYPDAPRDRDYDDPRNDERPIPPSQTEPPDARKETPPATKPSSKDYPTATKTGRPGRVKLPFPPYSELDVSGLPSGSLAKDPTSGKMFRVP